MLFAVTAAAVALYTAAAITLYRIEAAADARRAAEKALITAARRRVSVPTGFERWTSPIANPSHH
jgi:hypothetical protein